MRAFVLIAPVHDAEVAADVLFTAGVAAVEERPSSHPDAVELWTHVGDDDADIERVTRLVGDRWSCRVVEVDDTVVETWRDHVEPSRIDDGLVVVPAWHDVPRTPGVLAVAIDPGAAFGLGDHPTTVLTLRALRAVVVEAGAAPRRVLDVGSGSGVLGIVAALLGAKQVDAIDHHAAAVAATEHNAERNGVADVIRASAHALAEVDGPYDLVLANLLAPTIVELADDLRRVTAHDGRLVVSGILADRHAHVLAALAPLRATRTTALGGWAAVELVWPERSGVS